MVVLKYERYRITSAPNLPHFARSPAVCQLTKDQETNTLFKLEVINILIAESYKMSKISKVWMEWGLRGVFPYLIFA